MSAKVKIKIVHESVSGHKGEINATIPEILFIKIIKLITDKYHGNK